ncbi:MAG: hypothetical protein ACRD2G_12295, partial [Terriglobia bacterium]
AIADWRGFRLAPILQIIRKAQHLFLLRRGKPADSIDDGLFQAHAPSFFRSYRTVEQIECCGMMFGNRV